MVSPDNKYTQMAKRQMEAETSNMKIRNHKEHNENPDYWNILLKDIKNNTDVWSGKSALDFGCGCGRNVENLGKMADWASIDGVDISSNNIKHCIEYYASSTSSGMFNFYTNNGVDLKVLENEKYDFVMSTIVFQHICVHDIRFKLKSEIYRVLKPNGIFSFQMNFGENLHLRRYSDNFYDAEGTNSRCDTTVENEEEIVRDLEEIGFKNITCQVRPSFSCNASDKWIFVRCEK